MEQGQTPKKEHSINLKDRKTLEMTGIKEVDSFDSEEFLLETVLGYMVVRGRELQLKNLDVTGGEVSISGYIQEVAYVEQANGSKEKGFWGRMFQ
ncbi:sporulation protein YabP [Salimicrobium halophilum]|uniref:Sporulation protein YabP n=1 Tax=Salimicrobium halophilum TaxID=86666 RepID=A0A1G8W2P2_9BACI|nr:sporulation protein YabP [Salimicrobium halophilum]SDJ72572.1 sporulation protein YabP [Salimicrobium halophilum]